MTQTKTFLPRTKSTKPDAINPEQLILFGPSGTGKTTFLAKLDNTLIIDTEESTKYISGIMKVDVKGSWAKFTTTLKELVRLYKEENEGNDGPPIYPYEYIALDTLDGLYNEALVPHICKKHGKASISDFDYGAGYAEAKDKLVSAMNALTKICKCVIYTAHYKMVSIGEDEDILYDLKSLNFSPSVKTMLVHKVDEVGFFHVKDGDRLITFESSDNMQGKSRCHHLTGKTVEADWNEIFINEEKSK